MADTIINTRVTEIERSFDDRLPVAPSSEARWDLTIDIYEQRGNVIAKMALPGMNPENLDVYVDEDTLRISGVRHEEKETKDKYNVQKVAHSVSFSRTVDLPKIVDASKASAEYRDGVLQVTMPAPTYTKEKPLRIAIKA
jgi:HSP20 family protein